MRKFHFRFDAVEKLRKNQEQRALQEFAQTQRDYFACVKIKENLLNDLEQALIHREKLGDNWTSTHLYQLQDSHIFGLKRSIGRAEQAIIRAHKKLQKAMKTFLDARRNCKKIEHLKDKDLEIYKRERTKYEQKQLDELTTMRYEVSE